MSDSIVEVLFFRIYIFHFHTIKYNTKDVAKYCVKNTCTLSNAHSLIKYRDECNIYLYVSSTFPKTTIRNCFCYFVTYKKQLNLTFY